jgi:hypothetical protein
MRAMRNELHAPPDPISFMPRSHPLAHKADEAIAAVEELVVADQAYDKAREACQKNLTPAAVRHLGATIARRAAALLRVGGAA